MEPQIKTSPKDFFLYLFAAGSLYFCATTLGTLVWQLIDYWMPSSMNSGYDYYGDGLAMVLRWAIAMLLIVFPAYVAAMWWIGKDVDREPAKRDLKARKWFIWATLFFSAVMVVGDLVFLVYSFLGGEATPNFLAKVLTVAVIAGGVFGYHWYLLHREPGASMQTRKLITLVAILVVGAAVIGAMYVSKSSADTQKNMGNTYYPAPAPQQLR